jgi:WhiB family redox-sensing transcriptional regulator
MIVVSNCSRPRRPIQACCRRRGNVPDVAGAPPRLRSCASVWFPSLLALARRRRAVPPVMPTVRSAAWMSRGACRQADPELFFPVATVRGPGARQVEAAKAVCAPCAVRAKCLSYALDAMPEGIWGGTTLEERRTVRRRQFRRHANSQSPATVNAAMMGEIPTFPSTQSSGSSLTGPRDELAGGRAALTEPDRENAGRRSSQPPSAVRHLHQAGRFRGNARD